ncbi:MAG: hypothetical protein KDA90_23900, partial [Planctomycetaceae bacterium]|nr:hypothetical protein [Planctomycetaceae bacterium]
MLKDVASLIQRAQVHAPEAFVYENAPLSPDHWPSAGLPVNRDRIYDFYLKEANHFREHPPKSPLLPAYPGLDGGQQGHWGNQNEAVWSDDRWNNVMLGPFQAGVFHGAGKTVKRGVCVRLGEHGELAAVFDPMTLSYPVVWKTKGIEYVTFSGVRHGFLHGLIMNGDPIDADGTQAPDVAARAVYRGFYRFGDRTIFCYDVDGVTYLDAAWTNGDGAFEREIAPASEHSWKAALQGGPPQWDWSWSA